MPAHDDVTKWKHFPRQWPFVRGIPRSPVNSPHKGQWREALMSSLICSRINGWHNGEAGDLRRHRAHYYVILMSLGSEYQKPYFTDSFAGTFQPQYQGKDIVADHGGHYLWRLHNSMINTRFCCMPFHCMEHQLLGMKTSMSMHIQYTGFLVSWVTERHRIYMRDNPSPRLSFHWHKLTKTRVWISNYIHARSSTKPLI